MNKVVLIGRLTRDPDVRYSQGQEQTAIARYTLAVDRRKSRNSQEGQNADFISCVAFGKSGEWAEKYLHKGTKIAISGRIQTGSYTNRDGQKIYTTDVVVEDQEFAESKNSAPEGNTQQNADEDLQRQWNAAAGGAMGYNDNPAAGFMSIPDNCDEELPFH